MGHQVKGSGRVSSFGIRDLAETQCGIWENEKILDGIRDSTDTRQAGFAEILTRDGVLGKKAVLGVEISEVWDTGLS